VLASVYSSILASMAEQAKENADKLNDLSRMITEVTRAEDDQRGVIEKFKANVGMW
jgi:hypothetical protein